MRQIRFRAWDIENKVMCDVSHIFIANMVIPQTIMVSVGSEMKHCPDDAILMQFTGLHDKNGKEIFEGDIVGSSWGYPHSKVGIVDFENIIYAKHECVIPDDLEVIGNIYEHPELLKET